ncbi:MAG: DUF1156 domain-containing protein [Acidimicrobiia bacterium]
MTYKKKLIEVALPLDAINRESAREKEPFTARHPRSIHIWWARRPLAACRALIFASLVDDPSSHPDRFPDESEQQQERERLFDIIEELVKWENVDNAQVLEAARREIQAAVEGELPVLLDPFSGGGSIPLEAQRLGLDVEASDLNPVAVLITKALVEIPRRFAGQHPVGPGRDGVLDLESWSHSKGLAADIRAYSMLLYDKTEQAIGHLYPRVVIPPEHGGGEATASAWLWSRTARCPNPACQAEMPLARSFGLSTRKGKRWWVEPEIEGREVTRFLIKTGDGEPPAAPKLGRGARFRCLVCGEIADEPYIKAQGRQGHIGTRLMAIAAKRGREVLYLAPTDTHIEAAAIAGPPTAPDAPMPANPRWFSPPEYGYKTLRELFTPRQLVALTTFRDLVTDVRAAVHSDAVSAGLPDNGVSLNDGGNGATAYADAIATYLALAFSRWADISNSIASWNSTNQNVRALFARQAIPMSWDFVEVNPFGPLAPVTSIAGNTADALEGGPRFGSGVVRQLDAASWTPNLGRYLVVTDPPYYDNIGYADLSDFFYVWLRDTLRGCYPDLFSTLLTPKAAELVATPYRYGGSRATAQEAFEKGLKEAFRNVALAQDPRFPAVIYYAFKQSEHDESVAGTVSTGWETMLSGLMASGLAIVGTWPLRTERATRSVSLRTNALASSIALVVRRRPADAPLATRSEFLAAVRRELPPALRLLQKGNVAPVDLAQAVIGPGMAVFSRYDKVIEADGTSMTIRQALALINRVLEEAVSEEETDFDSDTRWALTWFEQHGMNEGPYGDADVLARAKDTSVAGVVQAGVATSRAGRVRLVERGTRVEPWDPASDDRLTVWEATQHLIERIEDSETAAAELLRQLGGGMGDRARQLAYLLYQTCDRRGWADDALAYNGIVQAWPELTKLARRSEGPVQQVLGE